MFIRFIHSFKPDTKQILSTIIYRCNIFFILFTITVRLIINYSLDDQIYDNQIYDNHMYDHSIKFLFYSIKFLPTKHE